MKPKTKKTVIILFLSIMILMALAVTAYFIYPRGPVDQAVRLRAEAFMKAKVSKDYAKAYPFFDSTYQKTVSEQQFARKMGKMELTGFAIESVTVDPDGTRATVKVKSDVSSAGFDFKGNIETQNWVKEGREWFLHVPPKDPKEFFQ
jgi:exopolysaccharide biosynthesis protein